VVALLVLGAWFIRLDPLAWGGGEPAIPSSDGERYLEMVGALHPCPEQPFCWRVAVPLLVRSLPLPASSGFWVLTAVALVAWTILVHSFGRRHGLGPVLAGVGTALLLTVPQAAKYFVADPWRTDPVFWCVLATAVIVARWGRWWWLVPLTVIGVLVREAAVLIALLYLGVAARSWLDRRTLVRAGLILAAGVSTIILVRLALPATIGLDAGTAFEEYRAARLRRLWPLDRGALLELDRLTFGVWGPSVLLLAVWGAVLRPRLALRLLPFLAAVYAQIVIVSNLERVLFMAFPAMLWLALVGLEDVYRRHGPLSVTAFVIVPLTFSLVLGPVRTTLAATGLELAVLTIGVAAGIALPIMGCAPGGERGRGPCS